MSNDRRILTGGFSPNIRETLPDGTDNREVKGTFKTSSSGTRDVSLEKGKNHIPAASGQGPQERPVDDWEIKIQENEQLFFNKVAEILTTDYAPSEKARVRDELKTLHTCMTELLTEYSRRISELAVNDRIMQKPHQQIKGPMVRVFQTVKDELVQLEKALAPNASKASRKEVKDVLPIAKKQIEQANKVLAEAKALLTESTLPPLPEIKVQPVPKAVSKEKDITEAKAPKKKRLFRKKTEADSAPSVETISPEQRLQNLRQRLIKASPEHVPEILQHMVDALEKVAPQLEDHVRNTPNDPLKAQRKSQYYKSLEVIRKTSLADITAANVSSIRIQIKDRLWVCEQCIKDITSWQGKVKPPKPVAQSPNELEKVTNTHIAASDVHYAPLQKQVEALNEASSPDAQKKQLRALDKYLFAERDRFNRLFPLLQAVTTKCDFEQREPPAECATLFEAMGRLNKALVTVHKRALSEEYIAAIKEADAALSVLDSFDQKLPDSLWNALTETVARPDKATPHFLNLMCRRVLNEETGPLSQRASLKKFTDICDYLEKVQGGKLDENTNAETIQAFRKVVGYAFSSLADARALMAEVRTLEEVRSVGFQLFNWKDIKNLYLDQICEKMDLVTKDLEPELEAIREGRDELIQLTQHFTSEAENKARVESAKRLLKVEEEIQRAVEQIVKERVGNPGFLNEFRSNNKVCEKLQGELKGELGSIANIRLIPGRTHSEILSRISVKLNDSEEGIKALNSTLSGRGKLTSQLRERLLVSPAKELLEVGSEAGACQWKPYSQDMIKQFADDFVSSFEKYDQAVSLASKCEPQVNRLAGQRQKADAALKRLEGAIPTVAQSIRKARKRLKRGRKNSSLHQLGTKIKGLKGTPLKRLKSEAAPVRDLVVNMLRLRDLTTDEAIKMLEPLESAQQAAMGRTPALEMMAQPLPAVDAARTKDLENILNQLQAKYRWNSFWHRLTRRKRTEAVETAKSLVEICEACPHAPIANARMLDEFSNELKKMEGRYPDIKLLVDGLRGYADHLHKSSTRISYEQAREG